MSFFHEISEYIINNSSIINMDSIFETYVLEISQPNNYITRLLSFDKYTLDSFIDTLKDSDLNDALIKIKLENKIIRTKHKNIDEIFKSYYSNAIDMIFIFFFDNTGQISFKSTKNNFHYYKRHYIIHCQNIRKLEELMRNSQNSCTEIDSSELDELKSMVDKLKMKNKELCFQLDSLKLSSQENINYSNGEYLKLQLEHEKLQDETHHLKSKIRTLKTKLKEYAINNKGLNEKLIELQKENKQLKNENDELYIAIVNGLNEMKN